MSTQHINSPSGAPFGGYRKSFRNTGIGFAILGVLAILVPAIATVVVEQLVGWMLLVWGIAGIVFARSFRAFSEWKLVAAGFAFVAALGAFFILFPSVGATAMTAFLVFAFILEGALSILLGLRMSGHLGNWQWIVTSGACSFALGIIILMQWPAAAGWVLGFLVGLNFLSTGVSLLLVSRGIRN